MYQQLHILSSPISKELALKTHCNNDEQQSPSPLNTIPFLLLLSENNSSIIPSSFRTSTEVTGTTDTHTKLHVTHRAQQAKLYTDINDSLVHACMRVCITVCVYHSLPTYRWQPHSAPNTVNQWSDLQQKHKAPLQSNTFKSTHTYIHTYKHTLAHSGVQSTSGWNMLSQQTVRECSKHHGSMWEEERERQSSTNLRSD